MIKVTLEFQTTAQAVAALVAVELILNGEKKPVVEAAKKSAPAATAASNPQPAAKPASALGTVDPKPDAAASQPKATAAASPASEAGVTTYDQVKALILRVSKDKGGDAARAVLAGFGVSKGPELKPEQYAAAVEACEAALA